MLLLSEGSIAASSTWLRVGWILQGMGLQTRFDSSNSLGRFLKEDGVHAK
jgi:hypothetical protein